jgi:hypothetical protein
MYILYLSLSYKSISQTCMYMCVLLIDVLPHIYIYILNIIYLLSY